MKTLSHFCLAFALAPLLGAAAPVEFGSPGFAPTRMDEQGRLVEDWGTFGFKLSGPGITAAAPSVTSTKLDGVVPAACAKWNLGAAEATVTAFRAPIWPAGLDVYTLLVQNKAAQEASVLLALEIPDGVKAGAKTLSLGGRTVVAMPEMPKVDPITRDWGWDDDAVPLPGWAKPAKACDPAFRNIRAGMSGVPIRYRFKVEPNATYNVALGFCESHWSQSGQRPMLCQVEGAALLEVDPLARWGQHQPGAVLFAGRDTNGDGSLEVLVLPKHGAPDVNPILNAIWLFPPGPELNLEQVVAGKLNGAAKHFVDVGGARDQSLHSTSKVEFPVKLAAGAQHEMTFFVAPAGASAPMPDRTAWTLEKLRRAAMEVSRTSPKNDQASAR
jgi:hypothetical protein